MSVTKRILPYTKFAPVAPLAVMQHLSTLGRDVIGDYHLLLAHDVLQNPDGWYQWSADLHSSFNNAGLNAPTLIMDTSVIELGEPMAMDSIISAAEITRSDVVVLPDVIGDPEATIKLVEKFVTEMMNCSDHIKHEKLRNFEYMFVPQGTNLQQYVESIEFARDIEIVSWIGLPRDALKYGVKSRRELIDAVEILCPGMVMHLLGMSDNLIDDFLSAKHSAGVVGIDSAVPIRAGIRGLPFCVGDSDYGKREDYWESTKATAQSLANLQYARELLL